MVRSRVAVLKTTPATVIDDYKRLMRLADYQQFLAAGQGDRPQDQCQLALLLSRLFHHAVAA